MHYALYKKPWQYDDVIDGEYFWHYAKESPFYQVIKEIKEGFDEEQRIKKEAVAKEIVAHATKIIESGDTFSIRLGREV